MPKKSQKAFKLYIICTLLSNAIQIAEGNNKRPWILLEEKLIPKSSWQILVESIYCDITIFRIKVEKMAKNDTSLMSF